MVSSIFRAALAVACAVASILAGAMAGTVAASETSSVQAGEVRGVSPLAWHALSLTTVGGDPTGLPRVQDGPVLLQFWASTCHSCGRLMWDLDGLSAAFPAVPYLAVSIDDERAEAARIREHPLYARHPGRYLHDGTGALADRLTVRVVPTIVVLDAEGRERLRHVGHVNSGDLQRLRALLALLVSETTPPKESTP